MGVKVLDGINAISAEFRDSTLVFWVGNEEVQVPVPAVKTISFKKQCNQFMCENIFAYLVEETYAMILRFDGTGTVYLKNNRVLCLNFLYDAPNNSSYHVYKGGAYMPPKKTNYHLVELFTKDYKNYILSVIGVPFSVTLHGASNKLYMNESQRYSLEGFPELRMIENKLYAVSTHGDIMYPIVGELNISSNYCIF